MPLLRRGAAAHDAAAWRGLGYRLSEDGTALIAPDGRRCRGAPDVLSDAATLGKFDAALPHDDDDEMACLDVLIETLHGETLTRSLVKDGDADFLARRALVQWLYVTQPGVAMG